MVAPTFLMLRKFRYALDTSSTLDADEVTVFVNFILVGDEGFQVLIFLLANVAIYPVLVDT